MVIVDCTDIALFHFFSAFFVVFFRFVLIIK